MDEYLATDAQIMAASLSDPACFGEVYERHVDAIYAYYTRRVDRSVAADLTSDGVCREFG